MGFGLSPRRREKYLWEQTPYDEQCGEPNEPKLFAEPEALRNAVGLDAAAKQGKVRA